ncbi:MAG: FtsX-like permease family protein [Armatimonadetes bacterium]|nr:FtsX-like permease family protein [Armatimonadota bacterium]NIO75944.1 FtsX-like permease family protein [Armatimonadota bacterium]NIO98756.1 FtsX-like permease family protein [Armatimonadota bacterium]
MKDTASLAWQALWRHKLRGLLAIAGVAIGITAITGIISAEASWAKALEETFAQLGVTKVAVNPPAADAEAMRRNLTLDDTDAIRDSCSLARSVVPVSWARLGIKVGSQVSSWTVKAAGLGIEEACGIEMLAGRPLRKADLEGKSPVCLVAASLIDRDFAGVDPVGQILRIGGRAFTVVGVFHDKSGNHSYRRAMVGERAEIYIPITTAQRIPQLNGVHKIIVEADDQAGAATQINTLMRTNLRAKADAEFTESAATMRQAALRSRHRVSLFIGLAGILALLVAGMGVANILFVSVTERSREIGLRRACGASASVIAWQFLAESVFLCLVGAVVGMGAAFALTRGFFAVAFPDQLGADNPIYSTGPQQLATFQLPGAAPELAWSALLVAAAVAVLTGLLAGFQPALAAAQIPPAEAIRSNPVPRYQLRSALTVLQLTLGVAAVLLLVSFYEGRVRTELTAMRESQSSDVVRLQFAEELPGYLPNNSLPAIHTGLSEITRLLQRPDEFRGLLEELTLFSYLDPRMQTQVKVHAGATYLKIDGELPSVCGTVPNSLNIDIAHAREADMLPEGAGELMAEGAFFSDRDLDEARRVCVLPHSVATSLFGSGSPVGRTVTIARRHFEVTGVLSPWVEKAGEVFFHTPRKQFSILIPATTFAREIYDFPDMMDCHRDMWVWVILRAKDVMQGPAAMLQLESALESRLRLPKHIQLYPQGSLVAAVDLAHRQRWAELRAGAGGLAALLIAIVGLVNMLLVSVHESVREVGLRRALGALRSQIGLHFIREGALLAVIGTACGVILSLFASHWLAGLVDLPTHLPLRWILLSGFGAILAGSLASCGPALRAANIQPIEALRYE